ncbi:MAG: copper resistance protein B [Gallionellaceae bacterium]|nr:copper resistance protein B [Gallionellaceae bacterium]
MSKKQMKILAIAAFSITLVTAQQAIAAEDMADMDHSSMPGMDHSKMNPDSAAQAVDMQGMDHASGGEMKGMSMQGGTAPADARDPHAYSGGFSVDHMASHKMADEAYLGGLRVERLEAAQSRDNAFHAYDLQSWCGKDYNKFVLKAEGEVDDGKLHEARTELLWGHAATTYWDTQLGVRYDSGLAPDRKWLAVGVQGLAPYWFEVNVAAYIGQQGRTALRLSAEYELLLTQKLIMQPRVEANFYGKQDAASELGSGLSSLVTGVRMRYEIKREFAPYIGVEWNSKFGGTANYARAAGERTSETRVVAGVRFWY